MLAAFKEEYYPEDFRAQEHLGRKRLGQSLLPRDFEMSLMVPGSVMNDRTCSFDLHRGHASTQFGYLAKPKKGRLKFL